MVQTKIFIIANILFTAPKLQSSVDDYRSDKQIGLYPNYNTKNDQFLSRGHLVANGDFFAKKEKELTFINTNIAPQWQLFNGGNWANVEKAVRDYAKNATRDVYVFTGTGGCIL